MRNLADEKEVYVLGYFDTDGNYTPYREAFRGYPFGNSLRDEDGMCWAVSDQYGDWVNPHLIRLGIKSRIKVVEVQP